MAYNRGRWHEVRVPGATWWTAPGVDWDKLSSTDKVVMHEKWLTLNAGKYGTDWEFEQFSRYSSEMIYYIKDQGVAVLFALRFS
jgi:hypothetical protein